MITLGTRAVKQQVRDITVDGKRAARTGPQFFRDIGPAIKGLSTTPVGWRALRLAPASGPRRAGNRCRTRSDARAMVLTATSVAGASSPIAATRRSAKSSNFASVTLAPRPYRTRPQGTPSRGPSSVSRLPCRATIKVTGVLALREIDGQGVEEGNVTGDRSVPLIENNMLSQRFIDLLNVSTQVETFVETPRITGATYRASGWIHVDTTQGRGRYDIKKTVRPAEKAHLALPTPQRLEANPQPLIPIQNLHKSNACGKSNARPIRSHHNRTLPFSLKDSPVPGPVVSVSLKWSQASDGRRTL